MSRRRAIATILAVCGAASAGTAARAGSPYDDLADSLIRRMAQQQEGRQADPLKYLAGDMTEITGDLSELRTDQPVQQKQERVVGRLDELIKLLEKQCQGGAGGGANPTRPLDKSILAKGPGGQGEMHDPKQGEKQWGQLPPKQREQILQSKTEGFPPGYESMLQSYYERLAAEQVGAGEGAEKPGEGGATTPPEAPNTQK